MGNKSTSSHRNSLPRRFLFSILVPIVLLILATSVSASVNLQGAALTATKSDALVGDVDGDGLADPGDTLEYTVVITNNTAGAANNVVFTDTLDVNTTLVSGSLHASPVAMDDAYDAIGNTRLRVGGSAGGDGTPELFVSGGSVKNNDMLPAGPYSVVPIVDGATAHGTVNLNGDGTFTYLPAAGYTGTDTFTYTLRNDADATLADTATVTITVAAKVWYVNSAAATNGDGRSSFPFNTLSASTVNGAGGAGDVDSTYDYIYLSSSGTSYTGGLVLENGQKLVGGGAALVVSGYTLKTAGSAPTLSNAGGNGLSLAQNNTVNGLNIGNSSGAAISGANFATLTVYTTTINTNGPALNLDTGTLAGTFTSITSSGGTNNIRLASVTGSGSNLGSGALSGASGASFLVSGGSGDIGYGGTVSKTSAGRAVDVQSRTGGMLTLSGAVTAAGSSSGIYLNGNTGSTIAFTSGNLALSTSTNAAFTAAGGGTVNVSGSNNVIATTTGTAVSLNGVGGSQTFKSISANGGANGIVLQNTTGSFTVEGDGTNTALGGNSSGGTISNMAGADGSTAGIGIYLNSAQNVTLRRMAINGTNQNYGIRGFSVSNLTLEYATINGTIGTAATLAAPEEAGEGSVYFGNSSTTGLTGSATVNKVIVGGGRARNFSVINTSGTLNRLTITGSQFGLNQNYNDATDSLAVEARNSGTVANVTVRGTTFTGSPGNLVYFKSQIGTTMDVVFGGSGAGESNALSNNHAQNNLSQGGMWLESGGAMTLKVTDNTFRDADGSAITLQLVKPPDLNTSATSLNGTVTGNTIGVSGVSGSGSKSSDGIYLLFADNTTNPKGQVTLAITNNTIRQYAGNGGIWADNTGGNYNVDLTITGNTTDQPGAGAFAGLALTAGGPTTTDDIDVCANITGNNFSAGDPNNIYDAILGGGASGTSTLRLPGLVPSGSEATRETQVESFVLGNNNVAGTVVYAYVDAPATFASTFIGGAACSTPSAFVVPSNSGQMLAQASAKGLAPVPAPRQKANDSTGFSLPLDLSKWLRPTTFVSKVGRFGSRLMPDLPALPDLSTLFASLTNPFAVRTAYAAPLEMPHSAPPDVTVNVGTLPAGKKITIKFRAQIGTTIPPGVTQVSNQGYVSGSGLTTAVTDDPATPTSGDPTITDLQLQSDLTVTKTNDVGGTVPQGGTWKWKLTVQNSGGTAASFASGQTILVDALPGTNVGYSAPTVSNLTGTGTINCAIAGNTLTCTAGTDVTLSANTGKFDVEFTATPSAAGTFINPTGGTCSVDPGGHVNESNEANNTCNGNSVMVVAPPVIAKTFGASSIMLNGTTPMTITLTNPSANSVALTGVAVTDTFPPGLQVASTPNASTTCGVSFAPSAGATTLNASGITLAASSSCTLKVDVTGTTSGSKTNTTNAVTSTNGGAGNTASATLQVGTPLQISKSFGSATKAVNQPTTLTFVIVNTDSIFTATGVGFADNLPGGLQVASTPNASNACGGTFTTLAGSTAITLTNGSLATSTSCSLSVDVVGTSVGVKNNTSGSISSNEGGNGNAAAASITITKGASAVSLANGPTPTTYGETAHFTATVSAALGGPAIPSGGTVQFYDDGVAIGPGVSLSGGQASLSTNILGAGTHAFTAVYSGDSNFETSPASSPAAQQVNKTSTATTVSSSAPTAVFGQNIILTATVMSSQGIPTGTATFFDGATSLGDAPLDSGGIAAMSTNALTVTGSPHSITARYNGDDNFATSTSVGLSQTVNPAGTTTALAASTMNPTYGQSVYFTATVSVTAPGSGAPTGSVTFYDGVTALYSGALAGSVTTFMTNTLTVKGGVAHNITARYNGATNFSASPASPAVAATVGPATLNVKADDKTKVYGAALPPLTASYTGFVLGQSSSVLAGAPTLATTGSPSSPVGSYSITVVTGSLTAANYAFHFVDGTLTVTPAQLTVIADHQDKFFGAANPTFTASITGFVNGDTRLTALSGAPNLSTTALANSPVGNYPISVTQGTLANVNPLAPNYAFSFVNGTLTVNKDNTSATLSASAPNPSIYGQAVTFTATVTSSHGMTPNGTVTFKEGGTALGTGTLNAGGVASFTTSALAASGSPHSITASYGGSSNFNASAASAALAQTVNKATTTTSLTADPPNPSLTGQAVMVHFTVTVNLPGGGTPAGTVTVTDGTVGCSASVAAGSCQITFNSAGAKTLAATYSGDSNHAGSTSNAVSHTVTVGSCSPVAAPSRPSFQQQLPYRLFLPFVRNSQGTARPDLIVQSIKPINSTLQIVLLNQGDAPVTDEFWVDLYVNPNPVPTKVNQIWQNMGSYGAVWGVTSGGLPGLGPNGTLALTTGDAYSWPSLSGLPSTLPAGTCLYVQVDSAGTTTTYGAVLETHEASGGMYNNISGIQLSGPVTLPNRAGSQPRAAPTNRLPTRK